MSRSCSSKHQDGIENEIKPNDRQTCIPHKLALEPTRKVELTTCDVVDALGSPSQPLSNRLTNLFDETIHLDVLEGRTNLDEDNMEW